MFEFIQKWADDVKPVAIETGNLARQYAEAVLDRLDHLADVQAQDTTAYTRTRIVLQADVGKPAFTVPPNELWVLEGVVIQSYFSERFALYEGGKVGPTILSIQDTGGLPLWGTGSGTINTDGVWNFGANGARFMGGSTVNCIGNNNGGGLMVLFIRKERKVAEREGHGGAIEPRGVPGKNPPNPETFRHVGMWDTAPRPTHP